LIFQTIAPEIEIITPIRDFEEDKKKLIICPKRRLFLEKSAIFNQQRTLGHKCWSKETFDIEPTAHEAYPSLQKKGKRK
jgi:hypothetical protein